MDRNLLAFSNLILAAALLWLLLWLLADDDDPDDLAEAWRKLSKRGA